MAQQLDQISLTEKNIENLLRNSEYKPDSEDKLRTEVDAYMKDLPVQTRIQILQAVDKATIGAPGVDLQFDGISPFNRNVTYYLGTGKQLTKDHGGSVMQFVDNYNRYESSVWLDPVTGQCVQKVVPSWGGSGTVERTSFLADGTSLMREHTWAEGDWDANYDGLYVNGKMTGLRRLSGVGVGDMQAPAPFTGKSTADKFDSKGRPLEYPVKYGHVKVDYDQNGVLKDVTVPTEDPSDPLVIKRNGQWRYEVEADPTPQEIFGAPRIDPDGTVSFYDGVDKATELPTGSTKLLPNGECQGTFFQWTENIDKNGQDQGMNYNPLALTNVTLTTGLPGDGTATTVFYETSGTTAEVKYDKEKKPTEIDINSQGGSIIYALQPDGTVKRTTIDPAQKKSESTVSPQKFNELAIYVLMQKDDLKINWTKQKNGGEQVDLKGDTILSGIEHATTDFIGSFHTPTEYE